MNGSRTITKVGEFKPIEKKGAAYAIRLATFEMTIDGETFVSALETILDHEPTESETTALEAQALEKLRAAKLAELNEKACHAPVREATWRNGEKFWWGSERRSSIRASIDARTDVGGVYLEVNGTIHTMSTNEAIDIVNRLEVYASECHKSVCEMANEIRAIETAQAIADYQFAFPEPINLNTNAE